MISNGERSHTGAAKQLPFHDTFFDWFDCDPPGADKFDRRFHLALLAGEQYRHDADFVLHARLADVETDLGELAAHLPDDRLLHLTSSGKREPAAAGKCFLAHDMLRSEE